MITILLALGVVEEQLKDSDLTIKQVDIDLNSVPVVGIFSNQNDSLPWMGTPSGKVDMKRFKQMTLGKHVLVGRKTMDTIPKLPGRAVSVITRDLHYRHDAVSHYIHTLNGIDDLLDIGTDIAVIGGLEIYRIIVQHYAKYIEKVDITLHSIPVQCADDEAQVVHVQSLFEPVLDKVVINAVVSS
jgi:dihydrofolate reductase